MNQTLKRSRFRTLVFWVYEPPDKLEDRLHRRVDIMLEVSCSIHRMSFKLTEGQNGLLREIAEMRRIAEEMYGSSNAIDHTEGVFQAIGKPHVNFSVSWINAADRHVGYKEFAALSLSPGSDPLSDPHFPDMLRQTKAKTFQYAKSQLRWIRKQLLPVLMEAKRSGGDVHVYVVPGGSAAEKSAIPLLQSERL